MRTDKKKFSTKLMTAMMAGTLAIGMLSMSAFAESTVNENCSPVTNITVNKTVKTDGHTYAPNTTFNFIVENGGTDTFEKNTVYAGVPGGLVAGTGAKFSPTKQGMNTVSSSYSATGTLKTDVSKFTRAGIYHYLVKEAANSYEGVQIDTTVYDVYVYVYANENGSLYVGDVAAIKLINGKKTKSDLKFENNYGADQNDSTHDIVIKKIITGNQAKKDDTFTVTVTVNGASGEMYKVVLDEGKAGTRTESITSGTSKDFMVTNDTTIHIYGLTASDTVTVVEKDNTLGYSASYSVVKKSDNSAVSKKKINEGINVTNDGSKAEVTNTKNVTSPTGIVMNYGPYMLMVALAGFMVAFFLHKRNHKEA